jgi:uncharacterized protein
MVFKLASGSGSAHGNRSLNWGAVLMVLVFFLISMQAALADPDFPSLSGRVVDGAGLLSAADEVEIDQMSKALEDKSSDQLVVVTLPSLQGYAIEDFGVRLARHWQIGQKDTNNGVLLIVAPKERKVRIEVGYGLEGVLTDTLAGNIVHNRILPAFRAGRMAQGIKAGAKDITDTLLGDAEEVARRAAGGRRNKGDGDGLFGLIISLVWLAMIFAITQRSLFPGSGRRGGIIIVPTGQASGRWNNTGGGFSGGGGSFGGGGFSGGGGSFGGGGASGGW